MASKYVSDTCGPRITRQFCFGGQARAAHYTSFPSGDIPARDSASRTLAEKREKRVPFDMILLQDEVGEEARGDYAASAIYALSRAPGRVRIKSRNLYFMPIHGDVNRSVEWIPLNTLVPIRRLRHGCTDATLEVTFSSSHGSDTSAKSLMLAAQSYQAREEAFTTLCKSITQKIDVYGKDELDLALTKGLRGDMSNYDYLMYLNLAGGRGINDLSQYPVFPQILRDYTSTELGLENHEAYRDLTKPIGALDEARLATFKQRYLEMSAPRFFQGAHHSTPACVINYLVRAAPGAMLRLRNGRFDMPDRLFHSIGGFVERCMYYTNQADVKELLPDFYSDDYSASVSSGILPFNAAPGQFLDNVLRLELGTRQDGKRCQSEMLRSRLIEGVSVIEPMESGLVRYGTASGELGCYISNSSRTQVMVKDAHESRVTSLAFVSLLRLVVSGAQDGCVKIWQLQQGHNGAFGLTFTLDLNAEGPVRAIAVTHEDDGASGTRARNGTLEQAVRRIIVAVLNIDGSLLVWAPAQYTAGYTHHEPIKRRHLGKATPTPPRCNFKV